MWAHLSDGPMVRVRKCNLMLVTLDKASLCLVHSNYYTGVWLPIALATFWTEHSKQRYEMKPSIIWHNVVWS